MAPRGAESLCHEAQKKRTAFLPVGGALVRSVAAMMVGKDWSLASPSLVNLWRGRDGILPVVERVLPGFFKLAASGPSFDELLTLDTSYVVQ